MPRVRRLLAGALTAGAGAAWVLVGAGGPAYADCPVMTFTFDATAGGAVLQPDRLTVPAGGCVTLHNATITSAEFSVGAYRRTVAAFDSTPYPATAAGTTQPVTASGAGGSARGSIVIQPRPRPASSSPSATPKHPRSSATAHRSRPPTAAATPTDPATASAQRTPTPAPSPVSPTASMPPQAFPSAQPSPSSSAPAVVVAGPLQPPTDRGTGLPGALAALAVVATAGALLRVLLAEPVPGGAVDGRDSVGAAV